MSNGNILFAHQYGITLIDREKKVVWHYDAPEGTEIHTGQPIGKDLVVFLQNGDPAKLKVVRISTGAVEREFTLPTGNPKSVHGHFRHARLTEAGTILVAHMDMKTVAQYDSTGKQVWSYTIDSPWSAVRLKNGNTLIATNRKLVREVDHGGNTVWELTADDAPGYQIAGFEIAARLPDGNTLVNNWVNTWNTTVDPTDPPVQALEFTPAKKNSSGCCARGRIPRISGRRRPFNCSILRAPRRMSTSASFAEEPSYSCRRATTGSTRAARRAGR